MCQIDSKRVLWYNRGMQVSKNEHSGNTQIVVDDNELSLISKAIWDEQIFYYSLLRNKRYCSPYIDEKTQKREWEERLQQLANMARLLGCNVVVDENHQWEDDSRTP